MGPMRKRVLALAFSFTTFVGGQALGEVKVGKDRLPAFEAFEQQVRVRIEPLPGVPANDVQPSLINGTPVNPAEFPAIFRMTTGGTCTATVIGPATMLLAAHCVEDLERIAFVAGGQTIAGICEHASGYNPPKNRSEDFALCLLEREISGFSYESVDIEGVPALGTILVLTGYGCTFEDGPLDGLLRIGVSTVVEKPFPEWPDETSTIYTRSDPNAGGAILCPGDSGGPLFRSGADLAASRTVVGVNSRTTYQAGVSLFAGTGSQAGRTFFLDWSKKHGQKICGVNLPTGCK